MLGNGNDSVAICDLNRQETIRIEGGSIFSGRLKYPAGMLHPAGRTLQIRGAGLAIGMQIRNVQPETVIDVSCRLTHDGIFDVENVPPFCSQGIKGVCNRRGIVKMFHEGTGSIRFKKAIGNGLP
jgi:hypothetical protein